MLRQNVCGVKARVYRTETKVVDVKLAKRHFYLIEMTLGTPVTEKHSIIALLNAVLVGNIRCVHRQAILQELN